MNQTFARLLLSVSALTLAAPAFAEDFPYRQPDDLLGLREAPGGFSAQMRGEEEFSYDSNPLRVATGEKSLFGSTTSPELVLRDKTPTAMVQADTRIDANFFDRSEYDSTDVHEKLYLAKNNERWTAAVRGVFDYDTTRSSEITNYGLNLPKVRSTRYGASPEVDFRATETDTYIVRGNYQESQYDNNAFVDYSIYQVSPAYEHKFDEKNTGILTLNAQRYESKGSGGITSDSIGPSIGWRGVLTQRLNATVTAGVESTDQSGSGAGTEANNLNYVFEGDLAYKDKQDNADIYARRAQEPFGNGTQTLLTSITLIERHKLNDLLTVNATAGYETADYDQTLGINLDSAATAGGGLAYRVYDNLDLTADYRYRSETLTNVSGDVNEHLILLGITFHPSTDAI